MPKTVDEICEDPAPTVPSKNKVRKKSKQASFPMPSNIEKLHCESLSQQHQFEAKADVAQPAGVHEVPQLIEAKAEAECQAAERCAEAQMASPQPTAVQSTIEAKAAEECCNAAETTSAVEICEVVNCDTNFQDSASSKYIENHGQPIVVGLDGDDAMVTEQLLSEGVAEQAARLTKLCPALTYTSARAAAVAILKVTP